MSVAQRSVKFQMLQVFYSAVIALFEQPAVHGILVSGLNAHGERETMIAYPRLLFYDGDNESHWDMSGCRKCWCCNVQESDLASGDHSCGVHTDCAVICSSDFNSLRINALR